MPRRPPRRSAPARRRRAPPRPTVLIRPHIPEPAHLELREPPHAHSVCRNCGRIAEVVLSPLDEAQLTSLAGASADEWVVEGISLSLTGLCPRCRREAGASSTGRG